MNVIFMFFYNLLWGVVYIIMFPYTIFKRITSSFEWRERMGVYSFNSSQDEKCIWIHGASLGEITAASQLAMRIREKFPKKRIVISSMTVSGKERAMKIIKGINNFVLLPFDFFPLIRNAIRRINPDTLILIETEIWPTLIFLCRRRGVKIVLANGRLSDKTFKRYLRLRYMSQQLFNQIDVIFSQSNGEAHKFLRLGMSKTKVRVTGSLKSDNSHPEILTKELLSIPSHKSVIVAGSVRKGEEEIIIKVFKSVKEELNETFLIIAPRHLNRVSEIENILRRENLRYMKRAEKSSYNGETVLILDTMGELRSVYSVADIAFVGGTLLPYGGHNLIEPAYFGVPILFGPYINNTRETAKELLESDSAISIKNGKDFKEVIKYLLNHPSRRKKMGENSRNYLKQKRGVVDNYIKSLEENAII